MNAPNAAGRLSASCLAAICVVCAAVVPVGFRCPLALHPTDKKVVLSQRQLISTQIAREGYERLLPQCNRSFHLARQVLCMWFSHCYIYRWDTQQWFTYVSLCIKTSTCSTQYIKPLNVVFSMTWHRIPKRFRLTLKKSFLHNSSSFCQWWKERSNPFYCGMNRLKGFVIERVEGYWSLALYTTGIWRKGPKSHMESSRVQLTQHRPTEKINK